MGMIPLKNGDEIRVIAPSQSRRASKARGFARAQARLESLGYTVSFGKNVDEIVAFGTASAATRADDFNQAFADKNAKAVMAINGGWSANEILPLIDWELVAANPKPLIGFSDITVLHNAIFAKTGNRSLLGPNFGTLGRMTLWQYMLENLDKVLRQDAPIALAKSKQWGNKRGDQFKTSSWKILSPGTAEGILLGGNLGTLYLLQGTEYQPRFDQPFIFLLEDDDEAGKCTAYEVARRFESLLQLPNFRENLQAVVIGRFQPTSKVSARDINQIIESRKLGDIPIVSNVDFGHTAPMVTLPIGGTMKITAIQSKKPQLLLMP